MYYLNYNNVEKESKTLDTAQRTLVFLRLTLETIAEKGRV